MSKLRALSAARTVSSGNSAAAGESPPFPDDRHNEAAGQAAASSQLETVTRLGSRPKPHSRHIITLPITDLVPPGDWVVRRDRAGCPVGCRVGCGPRQCHRRPSLALRPGGGGRVGTAGWGPQGGDRRVGTAGWGSTGRTLQLKGRSSLRGQPGVWCFLQILLIGSSQSSP